MSLLRQTLPRVLLTVHICSIKINVTENCIKSAAGLCGNCVHRIYHIKRRVILILVGLLMEYGYCRISKPKQSIDRQIRNIKAAYPNSVIVQEVFTRTRMDRKEWPKLMKRVSAGDTIVFDSVSRMSGNAVDGFATYEELYNKGVNLVFLKEPHINTDTYKKALENNVQLTGGSVDYILEGVNKYLMELAKEQIRLAFEQSEKEVEDLHQRTREGIETARLNGKQIGRKANTKVVTQKSIAAKEIIKKHSRDFNGSLSDIEIMQLASLSRNTYYKYKRELHEIEK